MNSAWTNRILLLLAWAGVFVAGMLTISHYLGKSLPCGLHDGCSVVAAHPSSQWFGIPVAAFGLGAYLMLAVLAATRALVGLDRTRPLTLAGFGISMVGTLVSVYLVFMAMAVIQASCMWCLASAAIMLATFVLHAVLLQQTPEPKAASSLDATLLGAFAILAFGGMAMQATNMQERQTMGPMVIAEDVTVGDMVQDERYFRGPKDAPVTIIEFADVYCPGCRSSYPTVKQIVNSANGRIRVAFRSYPLYKKPGHELALQAAAAIEYAADKGKFWPMVDRLMVGDVATISTMEGLMKAVKDVGLDAAELEKLLAEGNDKLLDRVFQDIQIADKYGLYQTPTFFLFGEGLQPASATSTNLQDVLMRPEYNKLIARPSGPIAPSP